MYLPFVILATCVKKLSRFFIAPIGTPFIRQSAMVICPEFIREFSSEMFPETVFRFGSFHDASFA